jgi:hypothetical protein
MYQEDDITKTKSIDIDASSLPTKIGFEEMIRVLVKAGYEIRKTSSEQHRPVSSVYALNLVW